MAVPMSKVPVNDRPRERLVVRGSGALSEQELLALLLRSGARGVSATDLAASLLAEYGGLRGLAAARPEELATRSGVGLAKACSLVAAFELGRRAGHPDEATVIRSAEDVARVARRELDGQRRERVLVLVCDSANRLRQTVIVSEGSIDRSLVSVREVLNAVLRHDGRAFAIAHNHPSGERDASPADIRTTRDVRAGANVVGLRFLGHVIICGTSWTGVN